MASCSTVCHGKGGQTLIGLLFVIAIILAAGAWYFGSGSKEPSVEGARQTTVGQVLDRGEGVECMNNLRQIRQLLMAEDPAPQSLKDLGLKEEYLKCPISGKPYEYDPKTRKVKCPLPLHQKY